VLTAASHAAGTTPPLLLGVKADAPPVSSIVSLLQAALNARGPRGKGKASLRASLGGFCDLPLKNAAPGSYLESTYREGHFSAHEFFAFLVHEIPCALLYIGAKLGFEPSSPSEMDTFFGSPHGPRQGAPRQSSERGSTPLHKADIHGHQVFARGRL
jgi:hypothetical protein